MTEFAKEVKELTPTSFWRQPISTGVVAAVIIFMALNLTDAFITLYTTSLDVGEEMNPLMKILLAQGSFSFLIVKYFMVAIAVIGIAGHCRQHREARWALFYLLLPVYLILAMYQLVMLNVVR